MAYTYVQAADTTTRLRRVPGLDVDAGLSFVANNVEIYSRLLARFVQLHQQDVRELVQQAQCANADTVQRLAHAIKGGAATLGAKALARLAEKLETAALEDKPAASMAELAVAVRDDYASLGRHLAGAADVQQNS